MVNSRIALMPWDISLNDITHLQEVFWLKQKMKYCNRLFRRHLLFLEDLRDCLVSFSFKISTLIFIKYDCSTYLLVEFTTP